MTFLLCAAALVMTMTACSDDDSSTTASESSTSTTAADGPTTLAEGDVRIVGSDGRDGLSLEVTAVEEDGEVTGEARFIDPYDERTRLTVARFECADTDTDGLVILGGELTSASISPRFVGLHVELIIREGDPDSIATWQHESAESGSCSELLESIPEEWLTDDSNFRDVAGDGDIETG